MGIVGEAFSPTLREQIGQRQTLWSSDNRDLSVINTINSTAWLRLASSVNVTADGAPESRKEEIENRVAEIFKDMGYPGQNDAKLPAKDLVLLGGSIRTIDSNAQGTTGNYSFEQRYGINRATFNTFAGRGNETAYGLDGEAFGYRPMPGLTGATITFYNDGKLSKADIQIKVNSPKQLDLLEALYLRPGYTILLEWGHEAYVDNQGVTTSVENDTLVTKAFQQFFDGNTDRDKIQLAIQEDRVGRYYNYDAFYGVIVNFTWTFNTDGTYTVTLKAISTGSVVESFKINTRKQETDPNPAGSAETTPGPVRFYQQIYAKKDASVLHGVFYEIVNWLRDNKPAGNSNSTSYFSTVAGLEQAAFPDYLNLPWQVLPKSGIAFHAKNNAFPTTGDYVYYITFDFFLALLQANCSIYDDQGVALTKMDLGEKPMVTIPGHLSADPSVCLIPLTGFTTEVRSPFEETPGLININSDPLQGAGTFSGYSFSSGPNVVVEPAYFYPTDDAILSYRKLYATQESILGTTSPIPKVVKEVKSDFYGYLNNVYLNIDMLTQTLEENVDDKGRLAVVDYVNLVLSKVQDSLGNINKFKTLINDSTQTLEIVDEASFGLDKNVETVFQSYGVIPGVSATIFKDLQITTTLSNEFASMISIGAQANGNQVGENATAFSEFNLGLVDRITPRKNVSNNPAESPYGDFLETCTKLHNALRSIYITSNTAFTSDYKGSFNFTSDIGTAVSLYRDYASFILGHFSGEVKTIPSPFFIPFNVNITLKGLAGVKIYSKFAMDNALLPSSYRNKVDYVITNVTHNISNNIWDTTLTALTSPTVRGLEGKSEVVTVSTTTGTDPQTFAERVSRGGYSSEFDNNLIAKIAQTELGNVPNGIVEGVGLDITAVAEQQLALWNGKTENNAEVRSILENYWRAVPSYGNAATAAANSANDTLPWSGATISYIMKQVDPNFPDNASHYGYVQAVRNNANLGYKVYAIPTTQTLKAKVGDILVAPRSGGPAAGHGDVIYKIVGNTAYAVGGNVGNTVKTTLITLVNGFVVAGNIGQYRLIIKKV